MQVDGVGAGGDARRRVAIDRTDKRLAVWLWPSLLVGLGLPLAIVALAQRGNDKRSAARREAILVLGLHVAYLVLFVPAFLLAFVFGGGERVLIVFWLAFLVVTVLVAAVRTALACRLAVDGPPPPAGPCR